MKSCGCAEGSCGEVRIDKVEVVSTKVENGVINPQVTPLVELGAPVCHPTEKMGIFERNLENLRLKRQSVGYVKKV